MFGSASIDAELTASKVGQTGGHLLTALGVALLFFGGGFSGLWFAFLGWFLANAARGEERSARFGQLTEGWRIEAVMTRRPVTVPSDLTISELVDRVTS